MKRLLQTQKEESVEAGMALLSTLLILSMTAVLGLIMFLSVNSDMLINSYYSNFRSSFYAADSGLNVARADLVNQVTASVPNAFSIPPIANPTTLASTVQTYISTHYGNLTALNSGQAANSWEEQLKITSVSFTLAPGSPTVTSRDQNNNPTGYNYTFNYSLSSDGTSQGSEAATV